MTFGISKNCMLDQPWPLKDVISKLCDAAEILLHEKNYDGHGYEEIIESLRIGREWIKNQQPVPSGDGR